LMLGVVTWNLHGEPCWQDSSVMRALLTGAAGAGVGGKPVDIIVVCFQEFIELTPENIVLQAMGNEDLQAEFERAALAAFPQVLGEPFLMVRSCGMVGLYVGVFIAERLRDVVTGVARERVRSGLYGQAGNKGAVAVRLVVAETSVCAFSAHLESGNSKAAERAAQFSEIVQHSFSGPLFKTPKPLKEHDCIVAAGDFNFRLVIPEGSNTEQLESMLEQGWPTTTGSGDPGCVGDGISTGDAPNYQAAFAQFDELMGTRHSSAALDAMRDAGLMEGPVLFPCTYRLVKGSQAYDKERTPAWCDRVLHTRFDVVRKCYVSLGGLWQSDHRPVAAVLETSLLAMPTGVTPAVGVALVGASPPSVTASSTSDLLNIGNIISADVANSTSAEPVCGYVLGGDEASPVPSLDGGALTAKKEAAVAVTCQGGNSPSQPHQLQQPAPQPRPPPPQTPGLAPSPKSLSPGQLVFAEHAGGWYLADVLRVRGLLCDVAWRRPNAEHWGSQEATRQYLCSTGADETCHGEGLPVATRVRLPQSTASLPESSNPSICTQGINKDDLLDLLG